MADVDLIREAYRNNLGRDASDEEVNNWVGGNYGGGGVNDWLNQIQNSGEAQSYRGSQAPVVGPSPTENHTWDTPAPTSGGDPWAQAAEGLTNTYKQFLGRDPGAGDIQKWLSGGYGYGSGLQDYDKFVAAIMGSPEARSYRPQNAPTTGYQNLEYWQGQGTPANDIFDPLTGQLRAGWQRTANGYQRMPGTATTTTTQTGGDIQGWLKSVLTGAASPNALAALEPELNKRGIKLQKDSDGNIRGRLFLPDGSAVDVVGPGGWGGSWQWINRGKNSGDGGGGVAGPKNQYSDPYTQFLEMLLKQRIGNLQQPVNDPYLAMYQAQLKQRADALAQNTPQLDSLIEYLNKRFQDLQGSGYTGAEGEAIRTGALDPIEQDRAAARKTVLARLAQRGITPDSGVAQAALLEVDKQFDALRGTAQTTLTTNDLQRREGRQQRAEQIQSTLAQIPEGRARESLDIYSTLNQLSSLARQEDDARQREAIGYGGALSDLGPQRLQLAMQAANLGGNPSSMFQNLMQLAGLNQNSAAYNAQNNSSLWSGLGSLAAVLANAGR